MKFSFTFFLLTVVISSFSQEIKSIKGRVIDEEGQPISYANVGIKDTQLGTATNKQGYFQLNVTTAPEEAYLVISAISYKTYARALNKIENQQNLEVTLAPHYFMLNEVEVSALDQNAHNIVQKALLNWHKNHTQEKYQLRGFYRELLRNDGEYVSLTEASFTMQDRGYHKRQDKRFRLDALRKSDDLREMDSLDIYYDQFMSSNDLSSIFMFDFLDAVHTSHSFPFWPRFNEMFVENNDFLLDSMAYYDDQLVYVISYFADGRWEKYAKSRIEYNSLIITADDFAVLEIRHKSQPKEITKTVDDKKGNISYLVDGKYFSNAIYRYKKYKGKWYPHLISKYSTVIGGDRQKSSRLAFENLRKNGGSELDYDDVVYKGRKLDPDKNNYYRHQQILITEVKNNNDGFKRIKNRDLMDSDTYIRDLQMTYNPAYWVGAHKILINPHLKAAKKQLKQIRPLEEQFIANGK